MGDDVDEGGSVVQKGLVENDFAASKKTRREDFFAGTRAEFQLAPMGA